MTVAVATPAVLLRSARRALACAALAAAAPGTSATPPQAGSAAAQGGAAPAQTGAAQAGAAAAQTGAPPAGRYEATLCVANAAQAPSCGPAEAEVRGGGAVEVRVSDIVYRLAASASPSIVVVTQGQMMIDAFDTGPQWSGRSLSFVDTEKQVRYELALGAARRPRR